MPTVLFGLELDQTSVLIVVGRSCEELKKIFVRKGSSVNTDLILSKIKEIFGIVTVFEGRIEKGATSRNFLLSDGTQRYFLKEYQITDRERIEEIHKAKGYFAQGGIPVILPIRSKTGETIFEIKGMFFALFPFVGKRQMEGESLSEAAIISMGEVLSRLHAQGKRFDGPLSAKFKGWDKEGFLGQVDRLRQRIQQRAGNRSGPGELDGLVLESIRIKTGLVLSNQKSAEDESVFLPNNCLVHGDYLDQNLFFNEDHSVAFVCDCERVQLAPPTFELFRSMIFTLLSDKVADKDLHRARVFFGSYRKRFPVSNEEVEKGLELFYLYSIHCLWVESEYCLDENSRARNYLLPGIQRIRYLSENRGKLLEKLLRPP